MTEKDKEKYSLKEFFNNYLDNIGGLTLVNLLFAGFALLAVTILFFASTLAGEINLLVLALIIPIMSPFVGGLFHIAKKLASAKSLIRRRNFSGE